MNNYLEVKVRNLWADGKLVSVSSPNIKRALAKGSGIDIECNGKHMLVDYENLLKKKPRANAYKDKYGKKDYGLFDFYWNPVVDSK